jgi:hypothetical protein
MRCNLRLILVLVLLGGAAAPPTECAGTGPSNQTYAVRTDLTDRPAGPYALMGGSDVPIAESAMPCRTPLTGSALQGNNPAGEASDAIHGLPAPDVLRPLADPMPHSGFR